MHFLKSGLKLMAIASISIAASLTSCKDGNNEPGPDQNGPVGDMETMTPVESKKFIEDVAQEALGKFRPADQKELIDLCSYFEERYGDLELPEVFYMEESRAYNPTGFLHNLGRAFKTGNASLAARAAADNTYNVKFSQFAGIYEPKGDSWVKTGSSSEIIFRFRDANGKEAEVAAKASGSTSDVTLNITDWDYDYDYETGYWGEYEVEYQYNIYLPHEVTATVKVGGTTLATAKATTSIDVNGHKLSGAFEVKAANIEVVANISGNDTKVTQTSSMKVSGELLYSNQAEVTGKRLCDPDAWEDIYDSYEVYDIISTGNVVCNVINKLQLYADVKVDRKLCDLLDSELYYDDEDYNSKDAARRACENDCQLLNEKVNVYFCFNNTKTRQGRLLFQPKYYEYSYWGGWEYYIDGVLEFESDESTYSFEDYFGQGFTNVQSMLESLIDNYERVWESTKR